MKRLHFTKANNLGLLHDELLTALPELAPVPDPSGATGPDGKPSLIQVTRVESSGNDIWLTVPDDTDETAIAAVIQAHDETKLQPDARRDRLERIAELQALGRSNWTTAQMRELIDLSAQELAR